MVACVLVPKAQVACHAFGTKMGPLARTFIWFLFLGPFLEPFLFHAGPCMAAMQKAALGRPCRSWRDGIRARTNQRAHGTHIHACMNMYIYECALGLGGFSCPMRLKKEKTALTSVLEYELVIRKNESLRLIICLYF